jgi:hypothetical protein
MSIPSIAEHGANLNPAILQTAAPRVFAPNQAATTLMFGSDGG